MEMGAVRDRYGLEDRVIRALNAGVDLLVFSNVKSRDTELGAKVHAIIAKAVRDGRIPRAKIEAAYERISRAKAPADGARPCGEGVTLLHPRHSGASRNPARGTRKCKDWIPAFAGMTSKRQTQ